jgi:predicted nucleotidyltransferase
MTEHETISKAVELLRQAAPGATIILFGSHARGEAGPESDYDFLVVEPEVRSRRDEMVRLSDVLRPLRIPVDVLVTSRKTFEDWADTPNTVIYEAAREGKVFDAVA